MSNTEQDLLMIKGTITELPQEDQNKIKEIYNIIKTLVIENQILGIYAMSLLGLELQKEAEDYES